MATFSLVASACRSTTTVSASPPRLVDQPVDDAEGRDASVEEDRAHQVEDRDLGRRRAPHAPSARVPGLEAGKLAGRTMRSLDDRNG